MKTCTKCKEAKEPTEFYKNKRGKDGIFSWCKACVLIDQAKRYKNPKVRAAVIKRVTDHDAADRKRYLLKLAKVRAKKFGVPFDLTVDDFEIPDRCPVLGIKLEWSRATGIGNSPSIDKIIPTLGYVRGNVAVISYRANVLKRDATLAELQSLVAWLELIELANKLSKK